MDTTVSTPTRRKRRVPFLTLGLVDSLVLMAVYLMMALALAIDTTAFGTEQNLGCIAVAISALCMIWIVNKGYEFRRTTSAARASFERARSAASLFKLLDVARRKDGGSD